MRITEALIYGAHILLSLHNSWNTGTSRGQLKFRAGDQVDKIGFGVKQARGDQGGWLLELTYISLCLYCSRVCLCSSITPTWLHPQPSFSWEWGTFGALNRKDGYWVGFWWLLLYLQTTAHSWDDSDSNSATSRQGVLGQEILSLSASVCFISGTDKSS